MTISLSFQQEYTYDRASHIISFPVRIFGISGAFATDAILDTGATISTFDLAIAPAIGISDVTTGEHRRLRAANGEFMDSYIHRVRLEFLGHRLAIPIAFRTGGPNLLGMAGFFEQFRIAFEHGSRKYYI